MWYASDFCHIRDSTSTFVVDVLTDLELAGDGAGGGAHVFGFVRTLLALETANLANVEVRAFTRGIEQIVDALAKHVVRPVPAADDGAAAISVDVTDEALASAVDRSADDETDGVLSRQARRRHFRPFVGGGCESAVEAVGQFNLRVGRSDRSLPVDEWDRTDAV